MVLGKNYFELFPVLINIFGARKHTTYIQRAIKSYKLIPYITQAFNANSIQITANNHATKSTVPQL